MFTVNPMLASDFYKVGHKFQYPEGTELVYSNLTPRSDKYATKLKETFDGVVVFNIQGFIKIFLIDHFNQHFFAVPKDIVVAEYKRRCDNALGKDAVKVDHIAELHDLGYLPLQIKALPEGSIVATKVPVLTVKNTLPQFFWLTNYIETIMSAELWRPMTSATTAYQYRKLLESWAEKTGAPKDFVLWQGHDFSFRGMGGVSDAAVSGAGHLLSFLGTDTIPAMQYLEDYYSGIDTFLGGSVPATEHAVMCINGQDTEINTFKRLIKDVYPSGIVSIVSDTWNFWKVITEFTSELKDDILNRKPNELGLAKVVFRPDSGNPTDILCGTGRSFKTLEAAIETINYEHYSEAESDCEGSHKCEQRFYETVVMIEGKAYNLKTCFEYNRHDKTYYYIDNYSKEAGETIATEIEATPAMKGAVQCLWDVFGGTTTSKGYKVLNERVGLIYGDSITLSLAKEIMERLEEKGFASNNIVFGVGSFTYCYQTRDSLGFAVKATYGVVNGEGRAVMKDPVTDNGFKKSAKGLLRVELENGRFVLYDEQTPEQEEQGELQTVFLNGKLTKETTIAEIRDRINSHLLK